ncbi:MAG TPA: hypothetical protein VMM54_08855 [Nitrospirota bacterium]|nr:hypothetical protein [Nitrospirota bacterium]
MSAIDAFSARVAQGFSRSSHDHAVNPEGFGDFIIVAISVIVVLVVLFLCVKYFLVPKERENTHIKRRILDDNVSDERESRRER